MLSNQTTVSGGQGTEPFEYQAIVKREGFEANHTGPGEAGDLKVCDFGVAWPRLVGLGRDHEQERVAMIIECFFAEHQGRTTLGARLFREWKGHNDHIPLFTNHGMPHHPPALSIHPSWWRARHERLHQRVEGAEASRRRF